jgi:hypothetical protein
MKFSIRHYYKPTPKTWRKIGDAILYGCGSIGATGLLAFDELKTIYSSHQLKVIIGVVLVLGFVGKFLSNFFKAESLNDKASANHVDS